MSKIKAVVYDGKYEIVFDETTGHLKAYRNREPEVWRDLTGDGMVLAMLQEIDKLKELNQELKNKLNQEQHEKVHTKCVGCTCGSN